MNKKTTGNQNQVLTILLVLMFIFAFYFTYELFAGKHSHTYENKPFEGFTYTKKSRTPTGETHLAYSTETPADAPTHKPHQIERTGYLYSKRETISVVLPKNKFSPIAAVRNANFTWDNSSYYNAHTATMPRMAPSHFDTFVDEKLLTKLDNIDFNQAIIPLMREANNNQTIKAAIRLIEKEDYDTALKMLTELAKTTTNVCVKSKALSHIANIYRLTGDAKQEKRAMGSLTITNAQMYIQMFPDKISALTSISPMAKTAVNNFQTNKPNLNFKLPNKDF